MTLQEQILSILKQLRDEGPGERYDTGICNYIDFFMYARYKLLIHSSEWMKYMGNWPKHSGSQIYPVPDPTGLMSASAIYHNTDNLWIGTYGDLRMELVNHMIAELEKAV